MFKAKITFHNAGVTYKSGSDVPNEMATKERLDRGLVYEIKTVQPEVKDAIKPKRKRKSKDIS